MKDLKDKLKKTTERALVFINGLFEEEEEDEDFLDFSDLIKLYNLICSYSALKPIKWDLLAFLELVNGITGLLFLTGDHFGFKL